MWNVARAQVVFKRSARGPRGGGYCLPKPVRREAQSQQLIINHTVTGLLFMLLPGTFLGVWNLIFGRFRRQEQELTSLVLNGDESTGDLEPAFNVWAGIRFVI